MSAVRDVPSDEGQWVQAVPSPPGTVLAPAGRRLGSVSCRADISSYCLLVCLADLIEESGCQVGLHLSLGHQVQDRGVG